MTELKSYDLPQLEALAEQIKSEIGKREREEEERARRAVEDATAEAERAEAAAKEAAAEAERAHADLSIARISELLAPHLQLAGSEPRPLPWHMFSVEFGPQQLRAAATASLDIYIDMRSYKSEAGNLRFENIYTFHEARPQIEEILHRLRACVHFDPKHDALQKLMPPQLFNCHKICVANKRTSDALYFSRVTTSALSKFLADHRWPEPLQTFARDHADDLGHLLWDVGLDFQRRDDHATPIKSGLYGSF